MSIHEWRFYYHKKKRTIVVFVFINPLEFLEFELNDDIMWQWGNIHIGNARPSFHLVRLVFPTGGESHITGVESYIKGIITAKLTMNRMLGEEAPMRIPVSLPMPVNLIKEKCRYGE